ncbi:ribonuclease III [Patescibacteria group bacterium]|nr:ribonuclease III [Patescibacteria group bacterium]MBU1673174.1 ribonuclease III [Patescibacteria group bacterium]MBU1963331.1 ribonuclease III [Patescibacteria group bacterium]
MQDSRDFSKLEKQLKLKFKDQELLKNALVHRSYLNENRNFHLASNERLEFLGDAVLEISVTDYLYRNYPNPEGELTNWRAALVNSQMLAKKAKDFAFEELLYLSHGEAKEKDSKARDQILANAYESIIGAIYLEHGYEAADKFINENLLEPELPNILENKLFEDPKSLFQETAQDKMGITPSYRVIKESGPDHNKKFILGVYLGKDKIAEGHGSSKHEAQVDAAINALEIKNWK